MNDGFTTIDGHVARFHSQYKTWDIYRCFDGGSPRMLYFACGFVNGGMVVLEAKNLSGIREKVTEAVG